MTKVFIQYNPYLVETIFEVDGDDFFQQSKLMPYKKERLQVWVHEIFSTLLNELNEQAFSIEFKGTTLDFNDLKSECEKFLKENPECTFELKHLPAKETSSKIEELENLVDYMKTAPFESFRQPSIKENFRKAIDSEFEIAVIATMSSGKSTFINAMLGQELMPSKNEACTATIAKIKNMDGVDDFSAATYDQDGNLLDKREHITYEDMDEFNSNPKVSIIKLEGDVPTISSRKMNLVLVDTPGPNNSQDTSHSEHTYRVIKNDDKPMVLYVLNATQLNTDDDNLLLKNVAHAMQVGGQQSKDRFIFALNKADEFDPEKGEDIRQVLERVKNYLESHGIDNPNIYPVSSETAKVIRMKRNGLNLTRKQKGTLNGIDLFLEEPVMHLSQYAPVSTTIKTEINNNIRISKNKQDEEREALYHTGIPAVEGAINEYLDKYAVTSKITNAVNSFRKIIEKEQLREKLQHDLEENEFTQKQMLEQITFIEKQLADGKKAKEFKESIGNLDINVKGYFTKIHEDNGRTLENIGSKFRKNKVTIHEADSIMSKARKEIEALQTKTKVELEDTIKTTIRDTAMKYINQYREYVKDIMGATNATNDILWSSFQLVESDIPDIDALIDEYTYEKEEWVGTKTVRNDSKKWYKPWTWGQDKYIEEDVYETRQYVDLEQMRDQFLAPISYSFDENLNTALRQAEKEKELLKAFFIKEISNLDKILETHISEMKKLLNAAKKVEDEIKEQEMKKQWLEDFVLKLDNILAV